MLGPLWHPSECASAREAESMYIFLSMCIFPITSSRPFSANNPQSRPPPERQFKEEKIVSVTGSLIQPQRGQQREQNSMVARVATNYKGTKEGVENTRFPVLVPNIFIFHSRLLLSVLSPFLSGRYQRVLGFIRRKGNFTHSRGDRASR